MKVSDYTIKKLGEMIAGDLPNWPYRRGYDLVEFFNKHGFREVYGEGFPTRRVYAENKVAEINGKPTLRHVIQDILDPRLWLNYPDLNLSNAAVELNTHLKFDGYEVLLERDFYKVRELSGSIIEVEATPKESPLISELLIEEQISKCREKIDAGDYSGAITNARSLVEAVCLHIEAELDPNPHGGDGDINKLFNRARKLLNLDPSRQDISDSLKQVLSGLSSIVNGLGTMRNKMSDAHGVSYKPSRHHAKLAVNSAKTLADFLFETLSYQKQKGLIQQSKQA